MKRMDKRMSQAQESGVQLRTQILDMLGAGTKDQKQAASKLQISVRQVRRLGTAY